MEHFEVSVSSDAKRDLHKIRAYIAKDKKQAALKWWQRACKHMDSLATNPRRYEIIPEADNFIVEFRHIIFGNYRIIYLIKQNEVIIVRVIQTWRLFENAWNEYES